MKSFGILGIMSIGLLHESNVSANRDSELTG
jgi:hypothetical protein